LDGSAANTTLMDLEREVVNELVWGFRKG